MTHREDVLLADAAKQAALRSFLQQFDEDRSKNIYDMALCVDHKVDCAIRYQSDGKTYSDSEYWAAPAEIVTQQAGDCEDYAILKYAVLCHLGVDPERLRVMTVGRSALGFNHAILVVDTRPAAVCAEVPLALALSQQKSLDGIFILENDGYGAVLPLAGSKYYAYGIMNEFEQKPILVGSAFRSRP